MQAYLLSGLGSPTSSFNLFLQLSKPRVSNHYHSSSVHYHYHNHNIIQSKLKLHYRPRPSSGWGRNRVIFAAAAGAAAKATNFDHQNHYTVLGISATASSTEIKRAYRILAKKYHPDVCKDSKSVEVFKSIRLAYEVLSNEVTRAQYDFQLRFQADQRWQSEKYRQHYETDEKSSVDERGSFSDVLISALFVLFSMLNLSSLKLFSFSLSSLYLVACSSFASSDMKLNAGSKMGYLIAWFLGGSKGIFLTLCLSFESWAFGKRSSSLVTLIAVELWVVINLAKVGINLVIYPARIGINLARYASSSIPQGALTNVGINLARYASSSITHGALIALLSMAIKLQDDLK